MKGVLATPIEVNELGLIIFKVGQQLDVISSLAAGGRLLLSKPPAVLDCHQSGTVEVPEITRNSPLMDEQELYPLWDSLQQENYQFIQALKAFVVLGSRCQVKDDHCHKELTVRKVGTSFVKLCWHHDHEIKGSQSLEPIARRNQVSFWLRTITMEMGLPVAHPVSLPELCWWLTVHQWITRLPESVIRKVLSRPESSLKMTALGSKSTDDLYLPRPIEHIETVTKPIVEFLTDEAPPARFMLRPKPMNWRNENYLRYVKSLSCVCCHQPADDPHHVIGHGQGKMGGKAHDLLTFPLCRKHHDKLHRDVDAWEREHGSQLHHVIQTIDKALKEGALV